jgi:hypothetical protein
MNKFREKEAKLLASLSVKIRASLDTMDELLAKEERILTLAELNRKFETDREKVPARARTHADAHARTWARTRTHARTHARRCFRST